MTATEMTETSLKIVRVVKAPIERVWQAFSDREAMRQWFAPGTRVCTLDAYDFREGGAFKLAFVPTIDDGFGGPSPSHGVFARIQPRSEIVMTWKWDFPDPDMNEPESRLVFRLRAVTEGTEVTLIHEGLPSRESVAAHHGGWQSVLPKLEEHLKERTTMTTKQTKSLTIKRVLKAPPERVYKAYLDPDAMSKWLPPNGFTGHVHHQDLRVGGKYRMSFSTIDRSWTSFFGGEYVELKPYERIVVTDRFEDEALKHVEMKVTVTLKKVPEGTEITIVQEGIDQLPAEMSSGASEGWAQSMENLARLVEADLPF